MRKAVTFRGTTRTRNDNSDTAKPRGECKQSFVEREPKAVETEVFETAAKPIFVGEVCEKATAITSDVYSQTKGNVALAENENANDVICEKAVDECAKSETKAVDVDSSLCQSDKPRVELDELTKVDESLKDLLDDLL